MKRVLVIFPGLPADPALDIGTNLLPVLGPIEALVEMTALALVLSVGGFGQVKVSATRQRVAFEGLVPACSPSRTKPAPGLRDSNLVSPSAALVGRNLRQCGGEFFL